MSASSRYFPCLLYRATQHLKGHILILSVALLYPVSTEDDDGEVRHINTMRRGYTAFDLEECIFRQASFPPGTTLLHSFSAPSEGPFGPLSAFVGSQQSHLRRLRHFHDEGGSLLVVGRLLPTEGCSRYPAEHMGS